MKQTGERFTTTLDPETARLLRMHALSVRLSASKLASMLLAHAAPIALDVLAAEINTAKLDAETAGKGH